MGVRVGEIDEPPLPTVFLGGQAFGYAEQDWMAFPGIAKIMFDETTRVFWFYWSCWHYSRPLIEDGILIGRDIMLRRCYELSAGVAMLLVHARYRTH